LELGTLAPGGGPRHAPEVEPGAPAPRRQLLRARGLPGGRAVVGALLVAASAVGIFAAYLQAITEPATDYLLADRTIEPGTRFASLDEVTAVVGRAAIDLPPTAAARAIPLEDLESLVGQVVVAPIERGDLLTRSAFVHDGGVADAHTLSFALPVTDAVAGALRPGERIDVVATRGAGGETFTELIVRGVPLVAVEGVDGGVGSGAQLTLTVAVYELDDVLALSHAVATAELRVVRSTHRGVSEVSAPAAVYRPAPVGEPDDPEVQP
jgi:hypothetical protein